MNDDLVVQKILKLLENNTAFIGYALNGGIGTKINIRNTETGKTIQALSVNVDSTGEVLVVKDSEDNQYKAVTFKTAEKVSERIIQLRKTKPIDDKKEIEYTDSDIEVFYLFVKLIDTGSPVPTQLTSTWIRKGSSCTQFVGAYERCNYASKETIDGVSYTGLPYKTYETLQDCLNDDGGRDAKTPHGTKDENGANLGWKYFSTRMTALAEQNLKNALQSHDNAVGTSYTKLFGYGTILECSGAMYVQGWEVAQTSAGLQYFHCDFSYLPGYTTDCTPEMQAAGYCDVRGFISSRAPLFGQEPPGYPSVGNVDNTWGHIYGWKDLPYEFMYKRHFIPLYLNGSHAQGSFYILEVNDDQVPAQLPPDYYPWVPGCPSNGQPGPYDGSGGNRFPDGVPPVQKRDMKLSTHKAEIWLGSSKKTEAIKLYELGASDLFSGMYNSFIIRANETQVDIENRLNRGFTPSEDDVFKHEKFYQNRDKNRIDLNIDPRVWVYVIDNIPKSSVQGFFDNYFTDPTNTSLHRAINNLYHRTINLTIVDKKTQVIHLKLGLTPRNLISNTDCKGDSSGYRNLNEKVNSQSWEYQKYKTITVENWKIISTTNTLDTTKLSIENTWNLDNIQRKFFTSFGGFLTQINSGNTVRKDMFDQILLRHDANTNLEKIILDTHFEQLNYSVKYIIPGIGYYGGFLYFSGLLPTLDTSYHGRHRFYALSSRSWWELWGKGIYDKKNKRLSSIVGYEKNFYQIVLNYGIGENLNYINPIIGDILYSESYFDYLVQQPKLMLPSVIKALRTDSNKVYYFKLADRKYVLENLGLLFYFAESHTRWAETTIIYGGETLPVVPLPNDSYYNRSLNAQTFTHYNPLQGNLTDDNSFLKRMDTRQWVSNLWAQLVYDKQVIVDVDSYKNTEFNLPNNPTKYKKFAIVEEAKNNEFSLATLVNYGGTAVELETVLSPGTLDITKQVQITKPTNVDLDPNYSFLVYIYPFVEVTKKKKTI